jgi:hypothetical protein
VFAQPFDIAYIFFGFFAVLQITKSVIMIRMNDEDLEK